MAYAVGLYTFEGIEPLSTSIATFALKVESNLLGLAIIIRFEFWLQI